MKNSKHEYRISKQIQNYNDKMFETFEFWKLKFVSNFGFRYSNLTKEVL